MRLKNNLQTKFLIYTTSALLVVFIFIGIFIGSRNSKFALNKAYEYTQLLAEKNESEVKSIFNKHIGFINTSAKTLSNVVKTNNLLGLEIVEGLLKSTIKESSHIEQAWFLLSNSLLNDPNLPINEWTLFTVNQTNTSSIQIINNQADINEYLSKYSEINSTSISEPYNNSNKRLVEIFSPIQNDSQKVGYIGYALNLNILSDCITNTTNYEGSSIGILSNSGVFVAHTNSSFLGRNIEEAFPEDKNDFELDKKILVGSSFEMQTEYQGEAAYTYFSSIKITENSGTWSVLVTVPLNKILASTKTSILLSALVSFLGLILIILVIYILTIKLVSPIKKVTEILKLLSKGNLKDIETTNINTADELQEMGENLNDVVNGLKKTESFALEIGKGKLENEYSLLGNDDQIGKALIDMRNNLKRNIEEDEKRKVLDQHVAWASNGIAKFSEILRQDNADMKKLGYNIISNLVNYLNVNQGALFVLNEDKTDDPYFELATAIAFGRDKFMKKEIKIGEGLVGRCAYEKKTIFITEVPASYTTITSGLGDAKPGSILIVPCLLNDAVYGIIELASFTPLKPYEIEFVEKLGESIGSTISSVRINLKTSVLLSASQRQGEELAAQEEELRQNLEEMEATQEDLKRQMQTNIEMQENMAKQNALLDSLLTSLPDYIYFKDLDSKFLRLSSSMIHLFGASSVDQIIGKSDFDFQTPENAKKFYADEQNIIRLQKGISDQIQEEKMPDGTTIWSSVTKLPLMTGDGKCFGTFGISKNVTELKKLEIEAKKQSVLLDSLLNSLPDYIYFKDKDSKFLRISKSMINLFGASSVNEVIGKSDFDYHTPENAKKYYADEQNLMKTGKGLTDNLQEEFLPDGTPLWMSVTKLPMIAADGEVFGTFGISKNVTELKKLEIEAKKQSVLLDSLLTSLPDYIYFKDLDSKFLRLSSSMTHLFGASSVNQIIGKSDFDFQTPENAKKYYDDEQNIIRTQNGITEQLQEEKMGDGTAIWTSVTKLPLLDSDGKCFGTFGITKNVTNLKMLEIEAQKQSALLDSLLNSLPDYIYFKDKESKFLRISKSMIKLFGAASVEEVIGKSDFDYHTPENAKKYYADEQNIMQSRVGLTNNLQREIKADGSIIWNSVTKLPLLTNNDECIGTFGISKDVTLLKNLEIESNQQKTELTGVIEAVKNSIYTVEYDLKGSVIDVNDALLKLLKVERKHYIGIQFRDEIIAPKINAKEYQRLWNDLLNGQINYLQNTFTIDRKEVHFYETYSPIKDADNKVVKILKMALDITDYINKK